MKTTAALIRHIFTIELPRVWDKELVKKNRRGGRGFITDMREKGEQWEAVILAVLQGLIVRFSFAVRCRRPSWTELCTDRDRNTSSVTI